MSVKTQIRNAKTTAEIDSILSSTKSYEFTTPKTRRQWSRIADNRKSEISNPNKVKATQETDKPQKSRKPRSDKGTKRTNKHE